MIYSKQDVERLKMRVWRAAVRLGKVLKGGAPSIGRLIEEGTPPS